MTQYVTPGLSSMLAHQLLPTFMHTYTRTPRAPATATDDWGEPVWGPATSVPNQPCSFMAPGQSFIGPNGLVEVTVPIMLVPQGDPLDVGDQVSNIAITDPRTGVVTPLLDATMEVENSTEIALEFGGPLYTQCLLRLIEEV